MKKLLLFDVDGTITKSGQAIELKVTELLQQVSKKYVLGIVGGGKLDIILNQIDKIDYFDHFFTECGCVYHTNHHDTSLDKRVLKQVYVKNIRKHELYPIINILIKECLQFLSNTDYILTGNFIDLRNGIVYISLIGMAANNDERQYFIDLNNKYNYIDRLLKILKDKAKDVGTLTKLSICRGGEVGISIYPVEYDKVQVLDVLLNDYDEIHYFGDKYHDDGNDYKIIQNPNIIGHKVDCVEDTMKILERL